MKIGFVGKIWCLVLSISISHDPKFGIPMLPHGLTAKLSVYLCRKKESARRKAINANIQQHWDKYKDFRWHFSDLVCRKTQRLLSSYNLFFERQPQTILVLLQSQYISRKWLEISTISIDQHEDNNSIVIKVGSLMGVNIKKSDISVSHILPSKPQSYSNTMWQEGSNPAKIIVTFVQIYPVPQLHNHSCSHLSVKASMSMSLSTVISLITISLLLTDLTLSWERRKQMPTFSTLALSLAHRIWKRLLCTLDRHVSTEK